MSKATLTFEDEPTTGLISVNLEHHGDINPESDAHRMSHQVLKWLDAQATTKQGLGNG